MRKKIVCGNWKMNTTRDEAINLASAIEKDIPKTEVEVIICPPFLYLESVKRVLEKIKLGAQNCYFEKNGAYTGEISAIELRDFCEYVILGHSERRKHQKESDKEVLLKAKAVLEAGLSPIVCVGETKEERNSGKENDVVSRQVSFALEALSGDEVSKMIFAYEPVWAISTGEVCSAPLTLPVIKLIREVIDKKFQSVSRNIPVLYGGSVNSYNVSAFAHEEEIDGVLVGGASLDVQEFVKIVKVYK